MPLSMPHIAMTVLSNGNLAPSHTDGTRNTVYLVTGASRGAITTPYGQPSATNNEFHVRTNISKA